jgi:Tol biopolymer transport system component
MAFKAKRNGKEFIVVGKQEHDPFDAVTYPFFSPDETKVAYLAKSGNKWHLMIENEKVASDYDDLPAYTYSRWFMEFSPDSSKIAFSAKKEDKFLLAVYGGTDEPATEYEVSGRPSFSPDSSKVAYIVRQKDGAKSAVIVNGKQGPMFDRAYTRPVFSDDGTKVAYGARDGRLLWWKVVAVE